MSSNNVFRELVILMVSLKGPVAISNIYIIMTIEISFMQYEQKCTCTIHDYLLYNCSYVKPLWNVVALVFDTRVNFVQILWLDELFDHGSVTTLICFLIYKEWLLLSLENRKRNPVICLHYFKNEIKLRIQIYEKCTCINPIHIQRLKEFILYL